MKHCRSWALLGFTVFFAACRPQPHATEEERTPRPPVVHMAPVPTRPFEDGYDAGFAFGKEHAKPKTAVPEIAEVEPIAHEQAAGHEERTPRWERGFVEGYRDGYRNVVTGQK